MATLPATTLLIDADDTLWENDRHYRSSTECFIALMAARGVDTSNAQAVIDACEHEHIAVTGFGPTSFSNALLSAAERLLSSLSRAVDDRLREQVFACTRRLFDTRVEMLPQVATTVERLARSHTLILVTKGEERFQLDKLAGSGLAPFFTRASVLSHKDASTYKGLIVTLGLNPTTTWMVGNSPRSDINPALQAGLGAVYIPHAHTWHQELEPVSPSPRLVMLQRFEELLELFGDGSA